MCVGVPMRVVSSGPGYALCDCGGEERRIDTMLVGDQPPGTWLLVFIDAAREVISADAARRIADALAAVSAAMGGATSGFDAYFPDLGGRGAASEAPKRDPS